MSLIQSDIDNLKKGAINFLYIFIAANAKGLAPVIFEKRQQQIDELKKIYQNNPDYSFAELVNIVNDGIVSRYGETPAQILSRIYAASSGATLGIKGIGSATPTNISLADQSNINKAVASVSTATDNGTVKKNLWEDVKSVIEWLITLLSKLFGNSYTNPSVYSPTSSQWQDENSAIHYTQSGGGMIGYIILAGIGVTLFLGTKNNNLGKKKRGKS